MQYSLSKYNTPAHTGQHRQPTERALGSGLPQQTRSTQNFPARETASCRGSDFDLSSFGGVRLGCWVAAYAILGRNAVNFSALQRISGAIAAAHVPHTCLHTEDLLARNNGLTGPTRIPKQSENCIRFSKGKVRSLPARYIKTGVLVAVSFVPYFVLVSDSAAFPGRSRAATCATAVRGPAFFFSVATAMGESAPSSEAQVQKIEVTTRGETLNN